MSQVDHNVAQEEGLLLREGVALSGLSDDVCDELVSLSHGSVDAAGLADRLPDASLRELVLAMTWELALADSRVCNEEISSYSALAEQLLIPADRAQAIRAFVEQRPT
jgi:hypothetical protein